MIIHYLKVAIRNILKYKVQNLVNVCAIAVSLTLLAIGASFLSRFRPLPLFSQPHADRTVKIICMGQLSYFSNEEINQLVEHQFLSTDKLYPLQQSWGTLITAHLGEKEERSIIVNNKLVDAGLLRLMGYESTLHPGLCNNLSADGVILTQHTAQQLFGSIPVEGARVSPHDMFQDEGINGIYNKDYFVEDVIDPGVDRLIGECGIFLPIPENFDDLVCHDILAVLHEGKTPDDLKNELTAFMPEKQFVVTRYIDIYGGSNREVRTMVGCILLFLSMFVLVSVVNYLRQQIQLARVRQREIALRTSLGAKDGSLYVTFCLDVVIMLTSALLLSLLLSTLLRSIVMSEYVHILDEIRWAFDKMYRITFMVYTGMLLIGLISMTMAVHHIKRSREGLALQMRPLPKHRLRNLGITLQLTISTVLLWMAVMAGMSRSGLRESFGIPDNDGFYKGCFKVGTNSFMGGRNKDEQKQFFDRVRREESVENIVAMDLLELLTAIPLSEDNTELEHFRNSNFFSNDAGIIVDFFGVDIDTIRRDADPSRHAAVSESQRKRLEDEGKWNGLTVNVWGKEYELLGTYDRLPFMKPSDESSIIIDHHMQDDEFQHRIIVSKPGMEDDTRAAIERIFHESFPGRVDLSVVSYIDFMVPEYLMVQGFIFLLLVLSVISVVTTVAGIYAGVALDTRRRRKEMALRKINGARTGDIRALFSRSYVVIFSISVLLSFALCLTISTQDVIPPYIGHKWIAYAIAVLIMAVIVVLTLAWRIRDVMRVDPAEYLKE